MRALSRQFLITFAGMGAILAYLPVLLKQRLDEPILIGSLTLGSTTQVGIVLATTGLAIISTPVIMTALADTKLQSRSIIAVLFGVSALTCYWQAVSHDFLSLFISHTVFAFFFWPLAALQDGLVFAANQQADIDGRAETPYHRVRTFGTIGFAIPLAGLYFLIGPGDNKDVTIALWLGGGFCVLGLLNALSLPKVALGEARRARFSEPATSKKPTRFPTLAAARVLFRGPALLFCICLFVAHVGNSAYYGFYSIYLTETVGFSEAWVGPITMLGVVLELGVMTTTGLLTAKFGLKWLIVGGLSLMVLRFALLGFFPNQHVAVWTQILHGSTVVAIYVVPPIYLNALAGDHFRSSIQGLYAMTVFGPSRIVGNVLGGELADHSLPMMFNVFSITTLIAVIGLMVFMKLPGQIKGDTRDVPAMVEGD
jgi:PPP family 3-phenylpropionic acid transporter